MIDSYITDGIEFSTLDGRLESSGVTNILASYPESRDANTFSIDPVISDNMCASEFYDQQTAAMNSVTNANRALG